jgi:hypothetical protein
MSSLVVAAKKALSEAPEAIKAVKWLNGAAAQGQFDAAAAQVNQETAQISHAVCRALTTHVLGGPPSSDQVDQFMAAAVRDPAFPARAYRLLGEAQKSSDRRRRVFLASVLFGLSFDVLPDDDRDRVDMAVERLVPPDVELLMLIAARQSAPSMKTGDRSDVFALINGRALRLTITDFLHEGELQQHVLDDERFLADRAALDALVGGGCVHLGERFAQAGDWIIYKLTISEVGHMVIRAIEEVHPGLKAES